MFHVKDSSHQSQECARFSAYYIVSVDKDVLFS